MIKNFAHLHLHTEYSMLDGSGKITEIVNRVKELGMNSVAITDHGVMYGVIDFYEACQKAGIHPVIGCEVYVAPRGLEWKETKYDAKNYHLILLAENQIGYQNLMKLVSIGFTEGFYYRPRIDLELLAKYSQGIIGLSACLGGQIPQLILEGRNQEAEEMALRYRDILGANNFFLELQDHGIPEQKKVNQVLVEFSRKWDIPLVATNDCHYTYEQDAKSHDVLLCIQTNKKVADEDRMRYPGGQFYVKSPEQMAEIFEDYPQALENTQKIADRCQVEFEFGITKLPKFRLPAGTQAFEYLSELCYQGLAERYGTNQDQHRERLAYELNTIRNMGYVDYFLIVWDFIRYARSQQIAVGPGRGSAAGSIVAYCLKITDIDPIQYGLIFERFLNPERVSMPDIDIDFCYERRGEVIDYVIDKYGADKVAQIITFGTMAARAVIRDVGRAYDIPYAEVDKIAKMVPNELKITIDRALEVSKDLSDRYLTDPVVRKLIDTSKRLEGLTRHSSVHAAGVVICDRPVYEYVPLNYSDGVITTQFTMNTLEHLGLLKMDFLGLRTLTVIQDTIREINKNRGIEQHFRLEEIDYRDAATYELIASGKTEGIFQLESEGMKSFMKELKPENLEDIIAGISLYRPGPMSFIPDYVKGKHYPDQVRYLTKELQPILKPTYGCIVYQEQVMQIVRDLAGYTIARSDMVRKAMSKKKEAEMERERANFIYGNSTEGIQGCLNNGISETVANEIYDYLQEFSKYAFNKSHAAAYAVIAYQTAYLKQHYPVEFMAALITSVLSHPPKMTHYILHLKELGIQLLPPDINESMPHFSVAQHKIRFGLAGIKNIGRNLVQNMVELRQQGGEFKSLTDYCQRMETKDLNKRAVESLIKAGSFDSLGGTRQQYMEVYKRILDGIAGAKKNKIQGQLDLFEDTKRESDLADDLPIDMDEYGTDELLTYEKEVMGMYVSGHPLEKYEKYLATKVSHKSHHFMYREEEDSQYNIVDGEPATIAGIVKKITKITTRKNQMMAFVELEDLYGSVEIVVFPNRYEQYKHLLIQDAKLMVTGKINSTEEADGKLVMDRVEELDLAEADFDEGEVVTKDLWLRFEDEQSYVQTILAVERILDKCHAGQSRVVFYLADSKRKKRYDNRLKLTQSAVQALEQVLNSENIALK